MLGMPGYYLSLGIEHPISDKPLVRSIFLLKKFFLYIQDEDKPCGEVRGPLLPV